MSKKILIAYDCMMLGGTTTAILSMLNAIDYEKYDVDLVMYRNKGMDCSKIPEKVNLLPDVARFSGILEKTLKLLGSIFNGQIFKGFFHSRDKLCDGNSVFHCYWK